MRSYIYNDGDLLSCQDSLPATVEPPRSVVSRSKEFDTYKTAMANVGFLVSNGSTYVSNMGYMDVYARDHTTLPELPLPAQRAANEFDFLCVLHIGGSYIRIWVPDFPNLFLFFKEIGARAEEEVDRDTSALRANASQVLGELLTGELALRVNVSSE